MLDFLIRMKRHIINLQDSREMCK